MSGRLRHTLEALNVALALGLGALFLTGFWSVVPGDGHASCGVPPPSGSHGDLQDCKTFPPGDENHPNWCC
jgi:hypothetical protein